MKIINFGSLNIDYVYSVDHLVLPGETLASQDMQVFPGGKGLNQSIAIARAGGNVSHAGMYAEEGTFLYDILKKNNVDVSALKKVNAPNGHAIIEVNKQGENSIILFGGTNELIDRKFVDSVFENVESESILLIQNEISSIGYIIEKAKEAKCRIVFNPAPMNDLVFDYPLELVDTFVVNLTEGQMMSGKNEPKEILSVLNYKYPNAKVILTLGSKGSYYSFKNEQSFIKTSKVKNVIDTTAAGDTFIGYYLAGISDGQSDITALEVASIAAAKSVQKKGASVSIPFASELNE